MTTREPPGRVARQRFEGALALVLYAVVSFAYFGVRLVDHPGRLLVGVAGIQDPQIFVWSFAWWPHAIGALIDPFYSHVIYAPSGVNLAWTTSVPGLALVFAPLTLAVGPDVSYNVAAIVLPALSAWTAYLLCRYLTGSRFASAVGGYLFGFSSYVLGHQVGGQLNLTGVFILPLVALGLVRYLNMDLSARGLSWRIGVLFAIEISISTEIALTLSLALVVGLVLALWLVPVRRARIRSLAAPLTASAALTGLLASPLLVALVQGYSSASVGVENPRLFGSDLLNLVVPSDVIGLGGQALASISKGFGGNINEQSAYLGLPAIVMIALFACRVRWSQPARFLLASLLVALLVALGTSLQVNGHALVALPWALAVTRPVLDNVIPARVAVYVSLVGAVIVALWMASTAGRVFRRPYVLPVLAVASLVPVLWKPDFVQQPLRVPFFTDGLYKLCIPRGETLAIFPFGSWGEAPLWQAENGFWFQIAEGSLGHSAYFPPDFVSDPVVAELTFDFTPRHRPTMAQLIGYAERHRVDRIISVVVDAYPDGTMMNSFGPVQFIGGVAVAPGCGYTSLTGSPGLPLPGQAVFGVHASYTVLTDSTALLRHAERKLGVGAEVQRAAALALLERSKPVLAELAADDPYDPSLGRALRLTSATISALEVPHGGPAELAESRRRLAGAVSALDAYAREIDSGVP